MVFVSWLDLRDTNNKFGEGKEIIAVPSPAPLPRGYLPDAAAGERGKRKRQ